MSISVVGWIIRMCYEYDAYFLYRIVSVGMMFSSMASGNDAGGLQSLRVALFATRIFV